MEPADVTGTEIDSCTVIDSSGTYTLTSDITNDAPPEDDVTCIEITADDVVLDGAGQTLEGNTSASTDEDIGGIGVRAVDVTNVTVRNLTLESWRYGVRFEGVTDAALQVTVPDTTMLSAADSKGITVRDSQFQFAGIDFQADGTVIRDNDIDLDGPDDPRSDSDSDLEGDGIELTGNNTTIADNTVDIDPYGRFDPFSSFRLEGNNYRILDNYMSGGPATRRFPNGPDEGKPLLLNGDDHVLRNNTVVRTEGVTQLYGDNHTITNNNFTNSSMTVRADNTTISEYQGRIGVIGNNTLVSRVVGELWTVRGDNVTLDNSQVESTGVTLNGENAVVRASSLEGLSIGGSRDVVIVDNNMTADISIRNTQNVSFDRNTVYPGTVQISDSSGITLGVTDEMPQEDAEIEQLENVSDSVLRNLATGSIEIRRLRNSTLDVGGETDDYLGRIRIRVSRNNTIENATTQEFLIAESSNNTFENFEAERLYLAMSPNNTLQNSNIGRIRLDADEYYMIEDDGMPDTFTDNNTVVGNTARIIQVTDDARNNTVRDNDAAISVSGEATYDNVIVDNNASDAPAGITLKNVSRTTVENNTVVNTTRGIVLSNANGNQLSNNTVRDSREWAFRSANGSTDNPVTDLTLGPTVSFESRDIALRTAESPPQPPDGQADIGAFLDVSNTSADSWANLTVHYTDADAVNVDEQTLQLWQYDGEWERVTDSTRLDTDRNRVGANVSGADVGVVAPLGNATSSQEPYGGTPPTLPTVIDASHFDTGGEGVAYHDTDSARRDDHDFRPSVGVDIESPSLGGSGNGSIGYVERGEWVEYTVEADPGTYTLSLAVAAGRDGELTASIDGEQIGTIRENTGNYYNFVVVEVGEFTVNESGEHVIRIESTGDALNFDRLLIKESSASEQPRIEIDPARTTVAADESFQVAVQYNATPSAEVYGAQFILDYNTSLLNATTVSKGPYLGTEDETVVVTNTIDDDAGRIDYGEARRVDGAVTGTGVIAYVNFTTTDQLDAPRSESTLGFTQVKISDPEGQPIDSERRNGTIVVASNTPPSVSASLSDDVHNVGSDVTVRASVSDSDGQVRQVRFLDPDGEQADRIDCTTDSCEGTVTVTATPERSSWNESLGDYAQVAYRVVATDDAGATATATVRTRIRIAGDATGDGVVDIFDAVRVGRAWNCAAGEECYSDAADLNNDGAVDIFDAVLIGRNWGDEAA